jgi:hypothetical protein
MKYIGVKILNSAELMTKQVYCDMRGWNVPADEDPNEEVYLVEYEATEGTKPNLNPYKGYVSMSPKDVFEKAYRPCEKMSFGLAVEAARLGKKIARVGWNGANMFAYIVPAAKYKAQTSVIMDMAFDNDMIPYREYWALFTAQKDIAMWSPSGSDSLAEDWMIVK